MTGFIGSLTTFSTFSYDTFNLFTSGEYTKAIINIILNNILSLGALCIAVILTKYTITLR